MTMKYIAFSFVFIALLLCSCRKSKTEVIPSSNSQTEAVVDSANTSTRQITEDMAYEGVNNYCHSEYDWSIAKDNPDIMYVQMGEETETEYEVIFRSYTGAFVHFYVDKKTGTTRIVEKVPALDVEDEAGTINLFDYLKKVN